MFNKRKVLYSAMVATLLSHAGGVMAAGLDMSSWGGAAQTAAPGIASEEISSTGSTSDSGIMSVKYVTSGSINADFNMVFTLSGGAVWGSTLSSASLTCTTTGTTCPAITRTGGGAESDSSVTFLVQAATNSVSTAQIYSFAFQVTDKFGVLSTSGGEIKLTADLVTTYGSVVVDGNTPSSDKVETILQSKDGALVELDAEAAGAYLIDVAGGGLSFISSSGSTGSVAKLGTVLITPNGALSFTDFTTTWSLSSSNQTGGTLLITDAPFNASVTGGSGKVFIDVNNNGVYDAPTSTTAFDADFLATDVTDDTAKWEFNPTAMDKLANGTNGVCKTNACPIVIQADGTTTIQENPSSPTATLSIKYNTGTKDSIGKLLKIKRNGTVCKLYNIPASNAADVLSIRVTNTSNQEGIVKGTLQGLDGKALFTNEDLIPALASKATERIDAAALKTLAGGTDWTGRAVLTISSNIKDGSLEVYALVRNKLGGPLMNLSAGASGNGCD